MRTFITEGERKHLRKEISEYINNNRSLIPPHFFLRENESSLERITEILLSVTQNKIGYETYPDKMVKAILEGSRSKFVTHSPLDLIPCIELFLKFKEDFNPELNEVD